MSAVTNDAKPRDANKAGLFKRVNGSAAVENGAQIDVTPRTLDAKEQEWKSKIHSLLLDVMDLSLISTLPEAEARSQIREISRTLMDQNLLRVLCH